MGWSSGFALPDYGVALISVLGIGSGVEPWQYAALSGSLATDTTINPMKTTLNLSITYQKFNFLVIEF